MHAAALAEDAAIFDYDSHYDSIQEVRLASRARHLKPCTVVRRGGRFCGLAWLLGLSAALDTFQGRKKL